MFGWFRRRREPEVEVDPLDRLKAAVDEANEALQEFRMLYPTARVTLWVERDPMNNITLTISQWKDRCSERIYP